MENMNDGAGVDMNQDASAGDDAVQGGEQTDTDAAVSNGGDGEGGADASAEESQNGDAVELKDHDPVPYSRFKEVNDRLKAAEDMVKEFESIKNDPVKRQEFVEALGLGKEPANAQPNEKPQPAPFQTFLKENVEPQLHGHYDALARAMAAEWEDYAEKQYGSRIDRLEQALGALKLKEVETKIPDFGKYEKQVYDVMRKHPSLSPEEAYQLAAFQDRFKQGQATGIKKANAQQAKVSKTPITKNVGSAAASKAEPANSLRESMERAWRKHNSGE